MNRLEKFMISICCIIIMLKTLVYSMTNDKSQKTRTKLSKLLVHKSLNSKMIAIVGGCGAINYQDNANHLRIKLELHMSVLQFFLATTRCHENYSQVNNMPYLLESLTQYDCMPLLHRLKLEKVVCSSQCATSWEPKSTFQKKRFFPTVHSRKQAIVETTCGEWHDILKPSICPLNGVVYSHA